MRPRLGRERRGSNRWGVRSARTDDTSSGADYLPAAAFSFFFCFLSFTESFGLLLAFGFS